MIYIKKILFCKIYFFILYLPLIYVEYLQVYCKYCNVNKKENNHA